MSGATKTATARERLAGVRPIEVGVLGATGNVGQQFIRLLANHPWFTPAWLAASERSEGRRYLEATAWRLGGPAPKGLESQRVEACKPGIGPQLVFSGLDASAANDIEPAFAAAGHIVVSNARSFRMEKDVPLLIPEVNADHLQLVAQQHARGWKGAIVTNPNCSTVMLAIVLAPLRQFGVKAVMVTTLQAVSGAGYPGVPSLDILANVIPFISGEEEKVESETQKILGTFDGTGIRPLPAVVSAQTTRVPVIDGHTESISVALESRPSPDDVTAALRSFRGRPQELQLPSAPAEPIVVLDEPNRPQPRLDVDRGAGMTVSVGRIRPCPLLGTKMIAMGHNTIRGAAGAAILNAELMLADGMIEGAAR